jgi:hypothetical protein
VTLFSRTASSELQHVGGSSDSFLDVGFGRVGLDEPGGDYGHRLLVFHGKASESRSVHEGT